MDIIDKVALVTGAGGGIGRELAVRLAAEKMAVLVFSRNRERLDLLASEIAGRGGRVEAVAGDVSREQDVLRCYKRLKRVFGTLDVLINCAAIAKPSSLLETSKAAFLDAFKVNALGSFLFAREAARIMVERRSGVIVNMASKTAVQGYPRQGAYCASKHALLGMSRTLALEMRPYGIKVHTICPGGVDTMMIRALRPDIPADQLIQPSDIADLVLYLVRQSDRLTIEEVILSRFRVD